LQRSGQPLNFRLNRFVEMQIEKLRVGWGRDGHFKRASSGDSAAGRHSTK
jgi:hypothetical protein